MERRDKVKTKKAQAFLLAMFTAVLAASSIAQTTVAANDSADRVVLVSLVDRQLAVVENGSVVARFSVAVGTEISPTPTGEFRIVNRVSNPTYYHPGTVIPTGKGNPLGTRWLGLSLKGYGIHGTNAPRSIGTAASHGCIRLRNRDMERLFSLVQVGDAVEIRGERDEQIAEIFGSDEDDSTLAQAQSSASGGQ